MSDDDLQPDPPPVAEYRDPELARRFGADPVPGHRVGFWSDLEARLADGPSDPRIDGGPSDPAPTGPATPETVRLASTVDVADHLADHRPADDRVVDHPAAGHRLAERGWGPSRWLVAAAAGLLVAAVASVALITQNRSSSSLESASPVSTTTTVTTVATTTETTTSETTTSPSTTVAVTTTTSSAPDRDPDDGPGVDYFDGDAQVRSIGPGQAVAFSPDGTAVLVVDDAPGPITGCEGAELLALYTQDLATGQRQPTFGDGATVETGGIELRISPFGPTPAGVATHPVYWTDWCDGVAGPVQRGVLSADGLISMVEPVAADERHPFAGATPIGLPSPDGANAVVVARGTASVVQLDDSGQIAGAARLIELPPSLGEVEIHRAAWSPDGGVVALGGETEVIMWDPWSGEHQRFPNGSTIGLSFDLGGQRLAVVSADEGIVRSSVLSFGDLPAPVAAPPRCSGRVELAPLSLATSADSVPDEVATTAETIDRAAADCDWDALTTLVDEDFVASFGGDGAVDLWQQQEAQGSSPMWYLRVLLRQPFAVDGETGDPADPPRIVWPSLHLDPDCDFDDDDRRTLEALAYDADRVIADCATIGGYLGFRTAIDGTGAWRYFVEGD